MALSRLLLTTLCLASPLVAISGSIKTAPGKMLGAGRFDADRQLRNLRWVGGTVPDTLLMPGGSVLEPAARAREFQRQIDRSIELEKREQQK